MAVNSWSFTNNRILFIYLLVKKKRMKKSIVRMMLLPSLGFIVSCAVAKKIDEEVTVKSEVTEVIIPSKKRIPQKAHKITSVLENNCGCEQIELLNYMEGLTTKGTYQLLGCKFRSLDEQVQYINKKLTDSVLDFCYIDTLELIFINKGIKNIKTIARCQNEKVEENPSGVPIKEGVYQFMQQSAEFFNRIEEEKLYVEVIKDSIFIYGTWNNAKYKLWDKGKIAQHKSGVWILQTQAEDVNTDEPLGGCADGPAILDLEKLIWKTC